MYNMISYWLKYYRSECGLTQQQVADCLNIERSTYTYYETGKTTPDIDTLLRIAMIFHVDYQDLLKGCNTVTGKYVNDSEFDRIIPADSDINIKSQDKKYGNARFETEVVLKARRLDDEQREELMKTLNSMTNTTTKKYRNRNQPIVPKKLDESQATTSRKRNYSKKAEVNAAGKARA